MALKTSTKQPNGQPQVGLFDASMKNERKTYFKMTFLVSLERQRSHVSSLIDLAVFLYYHRVHVHLSSE